MKSDWGFACLIDAEDEFILFDTGAKGKILLNNMDKLGINPSNINKIVISHEHWDHKGGLKSIIPYLKDIELYHLSYEKPLEKIMSFIPEKPKKISEGVWTTGRLNGFIDEQSLILKYFNDCYLLTGCSHPSIEKILKTAGQIGNIV